MGQKIDPRSLRIGINRNWDSIWYAEGTDYMDSITEDRKIRKAITSKLDAAGVEKIVVKRSLNNILIEIVVARPGVVIGRGGAGIETLKKDLNKVIGKTAEIKIVEAKSPDTSAELIAQNIRNQVIRRVAPKYAMSREIEKAKNNPTKIKGIRIWVSGRIRGAEIARTEKDQWGTVPLATLRADIDYAKQEAQVPNAGIHGIKVWVYKGEKTEIDYDS